MGSQTAWGCTWIIGASSGIGRELALQIAGRGGAVAVSARSQDELAELEALSPKISAFVLDVLDQEAVPAVEEQIRAKLGPVDLMVYCAGVWHQFPAVKFDAAKCAQAMAVNHDGAARCIQAVLPSMLERSSGHIALVGSVAGYRGLPNSSAYSPSKAALLSLAETLHLELGQEGVMVSIVSPGFVETPMTAENDFPMPYIMKPDEAARRIVAGLDKKRFEIAFPWQLVWGLKIARTIPYWLWFPLARWGFYKRGKKG